METKTKNIKVTSRGDKVGRIHMTKQNLDKMDVRRVGALRSDKRKGRMGKAEAPIVELDGGDARSKGKRGRRDDEFDGKKSKKNKRMQNSDF